MAVDKEIEERSNEPRALAAIEHETRAADLRATFEVEQPLRRRDVPMRLHALLRSRRPPAPDDDIVRCVASRNVGQRHVRHFHHDRVERLFGDGQLGFETGDLLAQRTPMRNEIGGVVPGLLPARDVLRTCIARCFALLDRLNEQTPLTIELLAPVKLRTERAQRSAPPHRLAQFVGALADQPCVVHQRVGTESGTTPRYPQFGSTTLRVKMRRVVASTLSTTSFA